MQGLHPGVLLARGARSEVFSRHRALFRARPMAHRTNYSPSIRWPQL
jgi:hypothetical protein